MTICDSHCHFFSSRFLELLTKDRPGLPADDRAGAAAKLLGWEPPGTAEALAERWRTELARHAVSRCALIASIPGDEASVAAAVAAFPADFVGFFMLNPLAPDASERLARALGEQRLRCIALFPAMHRYRLEDAAVERVFEAAAAHRAAVFVHCGVLSVGVRTKLGLPSAFDFRLGDPLAVAAMARVFRRCRSSFRTSAPVSSARRSWRRTSAEHPSRHVELEQLAQVHPGLTLEAVFRQALNVAGPDRLLFGTDSSFFPRGWQKGIHDAQSLALEAAGAADEDRAKIFGGNFERIFPNV